MTKVICNTSPFQYLHQLDQLNILPALAEIIYTPIAVKEELEIGRAIGVDLPDITKFDWVTIQKPLGLSALPLIPDLGPGESEVLMLALETPDSIVILDDLLARRVAESLELQLTGTLGLLIDAKKSGLIPKIRPLLDRLQTLRFRILPITYQSVLKIANED